MEGWSEFLKSSTIHGLSYIPITKKNVRLFWILIVTMSFIGAGFMIYLSFKDWAENPIKTTLKTRPIKEITLPKVIVCPPKNTYTNLNYDIMMLENMTMDNNTRDELTKYAIGLIHDHNFMEVTKNLSLIQEENRYYNWYHGYSKLPILFWGRANNTDCKTSLCNQVGLRYYIDTKATSGSISTQYFENKFDINKIEENLVKSVYFYPPDDFQNDSNVTLHFEINMNTIQGVDNSVGILYDDTRNSYTLNYTPPGLMHQLDSIREVAKSDLLDLDMDLMPGFCVKWYYSEELEPDVFNTTEFKRYMLRCTSSNKSE